MGTMPGMPGMKQDLPPWTLGRVLAFYPTVNLPFLIGCLLLLGLYLAGVVRLRRRGDAWPMGRTVAWVLGVLTVALATCTGLDQYGMQMLSAHMLQHMVLSMFSPIIMLMGAPITLALRALPASGKGGSRSQGRSLPGVAPR